ncbi:MAG: sugar ABC transporter substrate-binding protein [Acetobacteraceae bacterium]|nr:sugar ABC transporter substrate-binding protein [Acetobacteraceae bacterium]
MGLSRRGLMAGAIAGAAGAALAGRARAQAPVVLQFWEGHSLQEETATIRMIEAFEAAHPDIKINRTKVAFGANFEKITTAAAAGELPDVSPIWGGFLPAFADNGVLLDLSKFGFDDLKNKVYAPGWDYVDWKGQVWGVPYAIDPRFLAFNVEAMHEAGVASPPATLDAIYDVAKALTKRSGNNVERYGFGFASADDLLLAYVNLLYAYGGRIFNDDQTQAAFAGPEGVAAGELMKRMIGDGYATTGAAIDGLRRSLLTGRVGMAIDGAWILYAQSQFPQPTTIDVAPIPRAQAGTRSVNVSSVGGYVVYAASKHPAEAARFVRYMATPDAQQYRVQLLKTGVSPGVVDEAYAKETFAKWPALAKVQGFEIDSTLLPVTPRWARIVDSLQPAVEAIGSGADVKQALSDAARSANRSLRRA